MSSELTGARGHDHTAAADGLPADRTRGTMDAAQARAENDAYDNRHAELARDQEADNKAAGMFSPVGHVPLTQEARDTVARDAAARDAAARDDAAAKDMARQDHRPGAVQNQASEQAGQHRADEHGSDRQAGQHGGTRDAPGAREAREASLEERMAKLIDGRVQAATDSLKTGYEAKLETMRAELEEADAKRQAQLEQADAKRQAELARPGVSYRA